jgi:hypothetical protein
VKFRCPDTLGAVNFTRPVFGVLLAAGMLAGQDPLQHLNEQIFAKTDKILRFSFEERTRWEDRFGVGFGRNVNQQDMLSRIRLGVQVMPVEWLKVSAMAQDARVPFFGVPAPNNVRDSIDLQEGFIELFPVRKTGFGAVFGRQMLDYGEGRVIGTPQWGNTSRTYDTGRLFYRTKKNRFEVLLVSPVKVLTDKFNEPDLGDRIWGTYDTFSGFRHKASIDLYFLRHSENKIGGFTGAGTLGTNSFGARLFGPLPGNLAYSVEVIGQGGHVGLRSQRAYAWFAGLSEKTSLINHPLSLSVEYKVASGTRPAAANSGTYDQIAAANHDKFGHQDLFGWRNLKTLKSVETLNISKAVALNLMYTNHWLYSPTDALYNAQGGSITVSPKGTAGTHVGQELDVFATYKTGAHTFGAGFGHFFKGEFIDNTTPHVNPRYFYVFQQYSFR